MIDFQRRKIFNSSLPNNTINMDQSSASSTYKNADSSSSSNSTTPPSETTLADDMIDGFETSELGQYLQQETVQRHSNIGHQDENYIQERQNLDQQQQQQPSQLLPTMSQQSQPTEHHSMAINTDYESSATEDSDLFTLGKYESAEFALLSYSRTNKLEKIQALLQAKLKGEISLNLNFKGQQKQNFSWSALHLACYFGHIQVVQQLLSKKEFKDEIDINIKNVSGDTPLHKATLTNRVQIVQFLLSNGANIFIRNCDGLLAKQLTSDKHILEMLEAAEQTDKNLIKQNMFKAVDNGDLKKLQEYFQNYDSLNDAHGRSDVDDQQKNQSEGQNQSPHETGENTIEETSRCNSPPSSDYINQMTDERGNTLLHLASMRGFKAICVYLLEHGFDPYRKNNLGQTCIDISSYQLRQLFMSVKPASSQLKRLSKERVTRFEGPLMKRVRILGWKQIYVVLENGVILLFNNRRDSMNRSRRGYKYLESASCEPDPNDVGLFNVCFSDRSRATFLVSSDHIRQYASFRASPNQETNRNLSCNQIELIRQKWVDSIRDHIIYSTEFIRKGLKINDYEDDKIDVDNIENMSSLNHLLPIDTIKSFFQEARAHYNILERHAESLCSLVQSINNSNTAFSTNSLEASQRKASDNAESQQSVPSSSTPTTTGARLFGFIRGPRQTRAASNDDEAHPINPTAQQSTSASSTRARNTSLTNEFLQDNWPCLLFHLRLLMESTENTKNTLGQALTLMEHQEQLRQNRIQDQEERCRVLEDSLHALARDHHELEKSLSMSQIYQSPGSRRSISMSTDLNEYFDAFEDFDDEKTMTPDSSPPSDDDIEKKIHELMKEDKGNNREIMRSNSGTQIASYSQQASTSNRKEIRDKYRVYTDGEGPEEDYDDEEEDVEDDLQSNCSALTVETVTEQYMSAADTSQVGEYQSRRAMTVCPSR